MGARRALINLTKLRLTRMCSVAYAAGALFLHTTLTFHDIPPEWPTHIHG
jgi:hypothetical protein